VKTLPPPAGLAVNGTVTGPPGPAGGGAAPYMILVVESNIHRSTVVVPGTAVIDEIPSIVIEVDTPGFHIGAVDRTFVMVIVWHFATPQHKTQPIRSKNLRVMYKSPRAGGTERCEDFNGGGGAFVKQEI
jgi:hypothetical protein